MPEGLQGALVVEARRYGTRSCTSVWRFARRLAAMRPSLDPAAPGTKCRAASSEATGSDFASTVLLLLIAPPPLRLLRAPG